ncbi:unnamed protein product [Rotaria sordida]|uniref:Uncharacterized protein n=1 Tax=Rotaria sordida TaxID=392033 RepID=A0A819HPX2_9BILA|nr:unnamed protein product [Rotaria sordida]CAF3905755.1 unnamed protein product [Rotaria sordida]
MGMMVSQNEDGYGHGRGYVELSSTVEVAIRPIDDDVSDDVSVKFGVPPMDEDNDIAFDASNSNDYGDDDTCLNFDETGSDFDYDNGCPELDNYLADPTYHPESDEYGDDSREVHDNQGGFGSAAAADLVLEQPGNKCQLLLCLIQFVILLFLMSYIQCINLD